LTDDFIREKAARKVTFVGRGNNAFAYEVEATPQQQFILLVRPLDAYIPMDHEKDTADECSLKPEIAKKTWARSNGGCMVLTREQYERELAYIHDVQKLAQGVRVGPFSKKPFAELYYSKVLPGSTKITSSDLSIDYSPFEACTFGVELWEKLDMTLHAFIVLHGITRDTFRDTIYPLVEKAMAAMAEVGVFHSDLTFHNIMVNVDPDRTDVITRVALIDFHGSQNAQQYFDDMNYTYPSLAVVEESDPWDDDGNYSGVDEHGRIKG